MWALWDSLEEGDEGAFSAELCLLHSGDICQSQEVQP